MIPAIFIGHGSPMNAIEDNEFTRAWKEIALLFPKPMAILAISAHWETKGSQVSAMTAPATKHDFYGFPEILSMQTYPAPGSPDLASKIKDLVKGTEIKFDHYSWGFDHGTWSVLKQMYPLADIPVIQLSIDIHKTFLQHFDLARELQPLRQTDILILCSGNIVHNLLLIKWSSTGIANEGYDWAVEFDSWVKKCLTENDLEILWDYQAMGKSGALAVPSTEHYIPLIYLTGLKTDKEHFSFYCEKVIGGSLSIGTTRLGRPYLDDEKEGQVLNQVPDQGIILIDTAKAYGYMEKRIGRNFPCASPYLQKESAVALWVL
jgi:4,5-DOPA dioxygenase extradiol